MVKQNVISHRGLEHLANDPNIRHLNLASLKFSAEDLKKIQNNTCLVSLRLDNIGLCMLEGLLASSTLVSLRVSTNPLFSPGSYSSSNVDAIVKNTTLKCLDLRKTGLNDEALAKISENRQIRVLSIGHNEDITDRSFEALSKWAPRLEFLDVYGTQISLDVINKLRQINPKLTIFSEDTSYKIKTHKFSVFAKKYFVTSVEDKIPSVTIAGTFALVKEMPKQASSTSAMTAPRV